MRSDCLHRIEYTERFQSFRNRIEFVLNQSGLPMYMHQIWMATRTRFIATAVNIHSVKKKQFIINTQKDIFQYMIYDTLGAHAGMHNSTQAIRIIPCSRNGGKMRFTGNSDRTHPE